MNERLTPPDWDAYDHNMLINVGDMKYYYENFTEVVDTQAQDNKNAITTLDGRVAALEHSIPVGPGGDGAYLHLGGTPDRYPSAEEMVAGDTNEETSFMVIARPDGIHFYNPKTKVTIPPKKGGGTIAVHGQFPQIFDNGHNMTHNGRMDLSGVYTAKVSDVGLSTHFPSNPNCKVLIVVNEAGEEHQTAFSPDGMASRIFRAGEQSTPWMVSSGGGSGGGDVSKVDLISGAQLVHANSFGSDPITTADDLTAANIASTPVVVGVGSNPGKKFIMADIADKSVTSLTATQVREGRLTYLVNMSSVDRSVELTGGCKFNMNGGLNTTTKQIIPGKVTWIFAPSIYGSEKIWSYMGALSTENIDIKDLIARLEALEAGGGPGSGGVTSFTGLTDTPNDYTGHGNRFLAVKADESGVEFVTTPSVDTKPLEDRIDVIDQNIKDHVADFELMRDGHIPTSWNGLGARPITSPNDITVADIAESPFVVGTGTVTGKKFILPDIAELGVMSLGSGQVREGRATYLVNLGNVDRTIEVTAGCKINVTGGAVTTPVTIPRKTSWMMSPGVFAGDKVWTFIGSLSAESLDIAALIDRLNAVEARPLIEKFTDLADTPADYRPGHVLRYNQAGNAVTSSEFALKHLSDTPSDYTGQKGKMLVVNSGETAMEFQAIPDHSGLQTEIDNNHNAIIALQNMDTVIGNNVSALDTRVEVLENAPPGGSDALEAALVDGSALVRSTSLFGESYTNWDTVSQTQAAKSPAVLFWGNSNGKSVTLPDIEQKNTTPLPDKAVRPGRIMFITNRSTTDKTVKVADGCLFNLGGVANGTTSTDYVLKPKNAMVLMSYRSDSTKWWVIMGVFSTEQTIDADAVAQTADWKAKVESGDSSGKVNSNCMFGAMQIKDGALSASELAACTAGYVIGTVARTCTLPRVKDVNASSIGADECRFGKQIRMVNMSTQTMTINVNGGGRIYKPDNTWATSITIAPQKFADFHAVWWPGGGFNNFAWVMMVP